MAFVRTVKTASGATAVQIVYSRRGASRKIEHIGSAHDEAGVAALKAAAVARLSEGQGQLALGLAAQDGGGPLPITNSKMTVLWDALDGIYTELFGLHVNSDSDFRDQVLARIIEPTSKQDSLRVSRRWSAGAFVRHGQTATAGVCRARVAPATGCGVR